MRMTMAVAIAVACSASLAAQQSSPAQTPAQDPASAATTITVAGCVQNESAVLKKNPVTREVGMADEFVITNAKLHKGAMATEPSPTAEPQPSEPVGTSGAGPAFGKVYRVTGDKENELKPQVGQRVEITGTFKHDEDAKAELGAVGTSGRAPTGDLTEANTPEITIVSIKAMAGTCTPGPGK
jgi:hypothetical protein